MTIYQFTALNEYEQAEAVWKGKFIGTKKDGNSTFVLYALDDFFVEVTYKEGLNEITLIKPFKTMRLLESYWEQVDISESGLNNF